MRRLAGFLLVPALAVPASALASPTVKGANHAVAQAITQESREAGWPHYYDMTVHCRLTGPSRYGCSFSTIVREGPLAGDAGPKGRVAVKYVRGRYYVGEPRFEHFNY